MEPPKHGKVDDKMKLGHFFVCLESDLSIEFVLNLVNWPRMFYHRNILLFIGLVSGALYVLNRMDN